MPTPSDELRQAECGVGHGQWTARTGTPKRSVFGNYRAFGSTASDLIPRGENDAHAGENPGASATLQASVDTAVARSFLHRLLALAFADPTPEAWHWLIDAPTLASLRAAGRLQGTPLGECAEALIATLVPGAFEPFLNASLAVFGHAARGSCPLNEIEYGDIKADPLFQPHRLADVAAFYRAFGLEVAEDAGERHDHLCLELEFMCVLAAKEACALEHQHDADELALCRDAQKKFLREHLGRWTPAFARRLAAASSNPTLGALAEFTRVFVEGECARFGVNPGSGDLLLRPVDEAADRMCDSCGLATLPPGAGPVGTST